MLYDYTTVTAESVGAVVDDAIAAGEDLLAGVAASETRTWETTLAPLNALRVATTRAYGKGPFMARVHPDQSVRDAAQDAEEKLSKWSSDIVFRRDLYEAIEEFAAGDEAAGLEGERRRLLEFTQRDFRRAGHGLTTEERNEVQRMRTRLVELEVAFTRNIDEAEGGLDLTDEQLAGMPTDYIERLEGGDAAGTLRVSLAYPEYYPFMDMAEDADLRRRLQFQFYNRALENRPLLEEAIELRRQIAGLFGMPSWAHYAMEEKMAKQPKAVDELYAGIVPALTTKGREELADLAAAHDGPTVEPWDHRYLHTMIKRERYGIDPSEVSAFFPLQQVLEGMFEITGEVFGLTYRELEGITPWHPDVKGFDVLDQSTGSHLATFYMDLFPREGKFGHAAAFDLVPGHAGPEGYVIPISSIVANFTKPSADSPSLLKHDEVVTLFHEFGHILHNSLGHTELARFSGFNTEWDFVEAPSQIMEHWCWSPDVLERFARHHETGEAIPTDLVQRLVEARDLHIGLAMLRQVSFGALDMAIHGTGDDPDIDRITKETTELGLLPFHEGTFYPASFGHLFGYDAGYYGYLWAKVFGDDMFSRFEEEGVLDRGVGAEYRTSILEAGGSLDAGDLLRNFLGREPNQRAFLRHLGIAAS